MIKREDVNAMLSVVDTLSHMETVHNFQKERQDIVDAILKLNMLIRISKDIMESLSDNAD